MGQTNSSKHQKSDDYARIEVANSILHKTLKRINHLAVSTINLRNQIGINGDIKYWIYDVSSFARSLVI